MISAYASEGFVYVGRAKLAKRPGSGKQLESGQPSSSRGSRSSGSRPGSMLPDGVSAVRFTPQGHVYIARQDEVQAATQAKAQAQQQPIELAPHVPAAVTLSSGSNSNSGTAAAASAAAPPPARTSSGRHLSIIVGPDDRRTCPPGPAFPFSAVGQIDFAENDAPFICTGSLISPRRVLTAGHCVWDVDTTSFVDVLTFAPGRYRAPDGKVVNPFGVLKWSHATLMKNFISSEETAGDVAVVALATPAPKEAGTLGLRSTCAPASGPTPLNLTTAGYPSDKADGECMYASCPSAFDCSKESNKHTCDTFMGQSGSALWDGDFFVRGVHVRGLLDTNENEYTTLSRSVLAKIRDWEGREAGGVL